MASKWRMRHVDPECWPSGKWAEPLACCLPYGTGRPWCFTVRFTYERCCNGFFDARFSSRLHLRSGLLRDVDGPLPFSKPGHLDQKIAEEASALSVDLFVRTCHARLPEILVMLRSVRAFWPTAWGVVVVLDGSPGSNSTEAESAQFAQQAEAACVLLRQQHELRCSLERIPAIYDRFPHKLLSRPGDLRSAKAHYWNAWSVLHADQYVSAQFVAIMDTDTVLMSFGLPRLLFAAEKTSRGDARPVLFGQSHLARFPETLKSLNLPAVAEFMDAYPMVIHRKHFAALRRYFLQLLHVEFIPNATKSGRPAPGSRAVGGSDSATRLSLRDRVAEAFLLLSHRTVAGPSQEAFCIQSALGTFLWHRYRDEYAWSVRHGFLGGVPLEHNCPRLRAGHHLSYWGISTPEENQYWNRNSGFQWKFLRLQNLGGTSISDAYYLRAEQLVMAGMCAVRWRMHSPSRSATIAHGLQPPRDQPLDAGWRQLRREMCGDEPELSPTEGPQNTPILGANLTGARLLGPDFPGNIWTEPEAAHCGELKPSSLLRDYLNLMGALTYLVG